MARPTTHEGQKTWVRELYRKWLGRTGSNDDVNAWTDDLRVKLYLNSLAAKPQPEDRFYEQIEEAIAGSPEALSRP
jgi:hypothetical protein